LYFAAEMPSVGCIGVARDSTAKVRPSGSATEYM
jgi:hypothetical protein